MKITSIRTLAKALALILVLGSVVIPTAASSAVAWPGEQSVVTFDNTATFFSDSSGLDFADGKLYVCDNKKGAVWVLDAAEDGSLTMSSLTSDSPKYILYKDGYGDPDAEGIAVDGEGYVYIAAERDNSVGRSRNTILKADLNTDETDIPAVQEWDIGSTLPVIDPNRGIESIEFVPFGELEGKLYDTKKGAALRASDYPDAVAGGVFFVGLEQNGHVYAYILYPDGSFTQIADIDTGMGKVMSLAYDDADHILWAKADDTCLNTSVTLVFNGAREPGRILVDPPSELDAESNYEGFAIASADYAVNGKKPVYFLCDGLSSGALLIGSLDCPTTLPVIRNNVFIDVPEGTWYTEAALWCSAHGYITGTGENTFSPKSALTRAMFVQILARTAVGDSLKEYKYNGKFSDVSSGAWYAKAVQWAVEDNVTGGTSETTFSPNSPVTREQLSTFFFAYAKSKGYDVSASADLGKYTDAKQISGWAANAVRWAVAEGLISGTSDTALSPKTNATRAQAAVILKNFIEIYAAKQK